MPLIALLVLSSCAPADTTAPPWPPGGELPGWYGVPEEPANVFVGQATLRLVNGGLQGELALSAGQTRPLYFSMKWRGTEPQLITTVIDPLVSSSFSAPAFQPPQSARVPDVGNPSCSTAEGTLLAYAVRSGATTPDPSLDELIGVGFKPTWLFPFQQSGYNQQLEWSSCAVGAGEVMPMQLQYDPRFRLALCGDALEPAESVCGQPPLDRTRIYAIYLGVEDDGRVFLSPNFVARVEGPVTFEVNGTSFEAPVGQLDTKLAGGPWRAGRNTVEIRQGTREPWSAEVVLPVHSLRPRLHEEGLREGDAFTVSWDEAPWAQGYSLLTEPLDVAPARVAHPRWYTEEPSVTQTFPGFRDGAGSPLLPERAMLMLVARAAINSPSAFASFHSGGGYEVVWTERSEVAFVHSR